MLTKVLIETALYIWQGDYVGFLKFLKKEKKQEASEDFDLPPEPPPLEDFGYKVHEMPDFEKISAPDDFPKFDFPENDEFPQIDENKFQFEPSFQETEEKTAPAEPLGIDSAQAVQHVQRQEEAALEQEATPIPHEHPRSRGLFRHDKRIVHRENLTKKEVYVRVDKFKAALQSISMMRSDLRKSEEALMKLESIKSSKDRSYDKVRSSIHDIQSKLIFVDKTLFRGD